MKHVVPGLAAAVSLLTACTAPALAPDAGRSPEAEAFALTETASTTGVRYRLDFGAAASHLVGLEASFPTQGQAELTLWMASWTPGSYLVRDFARQIETLSAFGPDGVPLPTKKIAKNRFRIGTRGHPRVVVRYRVYAREASVRTSFVDSEYAVLNGASLYLVSDPALPYLVELKPTPEWPDAATALARGPSGEGLRFAAANYDALVDAPILLGRLERQSFSVSGVPVELVHQGAAGLFDVARATPAAARITAEAAALWGVVPFERYTALSVFNETGGGLEHQNSTLLMSNRLIGKTEDGFARWLGLYAHELFHAWNGKRLRPKPLGPFDYQSEVYTPSLWIVEGFTSYYDDLLVARAGYLNQTQYLKALSGLLNALERTPGRTVQSADDASFDAWIKFYKSDENSPNATVSYYLKGAVLGFLLDARIRGETRGSQSLDEVLRRAYARYSGPEGYQPEDFYAVVREVGGPEIGDWLERAAASTDELETGPALAYYGLRRKAAAAPADNETASERRERLRKQSWLGVETATKDGRMVVSRVVRGSPANLAGLEVDDELLAVDGQRLVEPTLAARIQLYVPGDAIELLLSRRGRIQALSATLGTAPVEVEVEPDPGASRNAQDHLRDLLAPLSPR